MKKKTIWTIALIMGFSFLALLYLQLNYISAMANMKKEQFDESVNRALYQASRNLELNETLRYLEKDISQTTRSRKDTVGGSDAHNYNVGANGNVYSSFELKTLTSKPSNMPKAMILHSDKNTLSEAKKSLQEAVKNRYVYQKALLDEVVYSILYSASDKPLKDRINFKLLDQDLKAELMNRPCKTSAGSISIGYISVRPSCHASNAPNALPQPFCAPERMDRISASYRSNSGPSLSRLFARLS